MKTRSAVLILFGCLVTAGNAAADPFEVLPAGEAVFNVAATTSGVLGGTRTPVSLGTIESTGSESFIFPIVPNRPKTRRVISMN